MFISSGHSAITILNLDSARLSVDIECLINGHKSRWPKKSPLAVILLSRLSDRFGVNGTAFAWFESYLTLPKQFVQVSGCRTTQRSLESGEPQGSVLGPLLYLIYTSPIADIIKFHKLQYHLSHSCIYLLKLTVDMISHWLSVVLNAV